MLKQINNPDVEYENILYCSKQKLNFECECGTIFSDNPLNTVKRIFPHTDCKLNDNNEKFLYIRDPKLFNQLHPDLNGINLKTITYRSAKTFYFICGSCGETYQNSIQGALGNCAHKTCLYSPQCFTLEQFIAKSKEIYGKDRFNYDEAIYVNSCTKIRLTCLSCSVSFLQLSANHFKYKNASCICSDNCKEIIDDVNSPISIA